MAQRRGLNLMSHGTFMKGEYVFKNERVYS